MHLPGFLVALVLNLPAVSCTIDWKDKEEKTMDVSAL
jgi:hypothetical protein